MITAREAREIVDENDKEYNDLLSEIQEKIERKATDLEHSVLICVPSRIWAKVYKKIKDAGYLWSPVHSDEPKVENAPTLVEISW